MQSLREIQAQIRNAMVHGDAEPLAPHLVGGRDPLARLAVHRRHYATSLVTAILGKFPGTVWLTGIPLMTRAARDFVRRHPPGRPCIAEYAEDFPDFLATYEGMTSMPFLASFAALEWHLGRTALAVSEPPVAMNAFSMFDVGDLPDLSLRLQPGLHYCEAAWPIDEVIMTFLADAPPDRLSVAVAEVRLQVRGDRGQFGIARLAPGPYVFRAAVRKGCTIGDAAERALATDPRFDPGEALAALVAEGAVTGIGVCNAWSDS